MFNKDYIIITPPLPIHKFTYKCDNMFHIDYIKTLYKKYNNNGVIIIEGDEVKFYSISGTEIKNLYKNSANIRNKHNKGGQSAQRFGRKHDESIQHYIDFCEEKSRELWLDNDIPNIKNLIIAGPAEKKNKLYEKLHPKLKFISHKLTISDKDNIYSITDLCNEIFNINNNTTELNELKEFFNHIEKNDNFAIYGEKFIKKHMDKFGLKKLLIHNEYINYNNDIKNFEVFCENNNCQLIIISNNHSISIQFLKGYGGIGGIAWY